MAIRFLAVAVLLAALAAPAAGAQGVVCTAQQVANYSGAKLVAITGSIGWITTYYSFSGFNTAQIIYPGAINYTMNFAPGSSYLLYANYRFKGPGGLNSSPSLVFVLLNNTEQGCSSMRLFAFSDVVMQYNNATLLTAQQATDAAQKDSYNFTFQGSPVLVPVSNQTGIQMLVPGYIFAASNYTVYSNAENGTLTSEGNAHLGSSTQNVTSTLSQVGSSLSGIYNFFNSLWITIARLLGIHTA